MAKKKSAPDLVGAEYTTQAEPKAVADGIPVFCAHDKIVPIVEVVPNPQNPNTHPEEQIVLLSYIIRSQGWRAPITISTRSGMVVRGHGRLLAAMHNKCTDVPVDYQSYANKAEEMADLLADNRLAELSEIDNEKLADVFAAALADADIPMILSGYTEAEYSNILAELDKADLQLAAADDTVPEIEYPVITQPGDLWILGEHRLVCGDSTKAETLELLMQGEKAKLIVTDPPYNVDYEGVAGKIANDNLPDAQFRAFLEAAFDNMRTHTEPGAAAYIFHGDSEGANFRGAFTKAGFLLKQCLVWIKDHFVLGRQDYQWQHEPVLYGWLKGAAHYFRDTRRQTTILEDGSPPVDLARMSKAELVAFIRMHLNPADIPSSVLYEDKPLKNDLHPTMKPVPLVGRLIENSSVIGWTVLDIFGGSGSTLMACDILNRRARIAEYEPSICDVIVRRYLLGTGRQDVRCIRHGRELGQDEIGGIFHSVFDE